MNQCRNIKLMTTSHPFSASRVSQKYTFRFSEIAIDPAMKLLRTTPHSLSTCWGLSKPDLSPNKIVNTQVARRVMGGNRVNTFMDVYEKRGLLKLAVFFHPKFFVTEGAVAKAPQLSGANLNSVTSSEFWHPCSLWKFPVLMTNLNGSNEKQQQLQFVKFLRFPTVEVPVHVDKEPQKFVK